MIRKGDQEEIYSGLEITSLEAFQCIQRGIDSPVYIF